MDAEIPGLAGWFRDRLNSLKFGIVAWTVVAVSVLIWLANYYWERAAFAEVAPGFIIERGPASFLGTVVFSVTNVCFLSLAYLESSQTFRDYRLRLKIAKDSPDSFKWYSMANPLIYRVRGLFGSIFMQVGMVFAIISSLYGAVSFALLFLLTANDAFVHYPMYVAGFDPSGMFMTYLIKRLVFYGITAVLLSVLVGWSALNAIRFVLMRRALERSYEEQMRELAAKYPNPLA